MLLVNQYQLKPNMIKADVKRLMDIFGERGAVDGEIANYLRVDGTGGINIADVSDVASVYADSLLYSEFLTFSITPILKIDDAVGSIFTYLEK